MLRLSAHTEAYHRDNNHLSGGDHDDVGCVQSDSLDMRRTGREESQVARVRQG